MISIIVFLKVLFAMGLSLFLSIGESAVKVFHFIKLKIYKETASFKAIIHSMFMLPTLLRK